MRGAHAAIALFAAAVAFASAEPGPLPDAQGVLAAPPKSILHRKAAGGPHRRATPLNNFDKQAVTDHYMSEFRSTVGMATLFLVSTTSRSLTTP